MEVEFECNNGQLSDPTRLPDGQVDNPPTIPPNHGTLIANGGRLCRRVEGRPKLTQGGEEFRGVCDSGLRRNAPVR